MKENQEVKIKKQIISKDKMLEAGIYFGHKKDKWNPKMKPYILTTKKGTHIIDIEKTKRTLEFTHSLIKSFAERGASFIFVGTRKQAKKTIKFNAQRTNSFYVCERWLGGTLTNARTIFKRVRRMETLERLAEKGYEGYTKKEGLILDRELAKLHKNLNGIRTMRQRPSVMIVADPKANEIAVKEAKRLGVKVIGVVDTNNDPSSVDVAIPANDDSSKSLALIMTILADAIAKVKGGEVLFAYNPDEKIILPEEPKREDKRFAFRRNNNRRFDNRRNDFKDSKFKRPEAKTQVKETEAKTKNPATESKPEVKKESESPKTDLNNLKVAELREMAKAKSIKGYSTMKKADLIAALG